MEFQTLLATFPMYFRSKLEQLHESDKALETFSSMCSGMKLEKSSENAIKNANATAEIYNEHDTLKDIFGDFWDEEAFSLEALWNNDSAYKVTLQGLKQTQVAGRRDFREVFPAPEVIADEHDVILAWQKIVSGLR
jgi:hypothetical protein